MSIAAFLSSFRSQYRHGAFELRLEERIDDVVRREKVPPAYGAYVISAPSIQDREILCIGKAGTICQDGRFKSQTIRERLTKKQDGMYRHIFFRRGMETLGLTSLHFEWFVTFEENVRVLPVLAEAQLLAEFHREFNRLPRWNKAA